MNYLTIEMPAYKPRYKTWKRYGWKKPEEKANTREVLLQAGRGYCMYCYVRVLVAGKFYGQLEHGIERANSAWLAECVPNIGLACSLCNESFKKVNQNERMLGTEQIDRFHSKARCAVYQKRKQCTVPCKALRELQKEYHQSEKAHFILQPMGTTGEKSGQKLTIAYDILKDKFLPADNPLYDQQDRKFIESHIQRFHLNDPEYRTRKLMEYVKLVVDMAGELPEYEYNHLAVELFAEKISELSKEERLKICEKIYIIQFASI